MQRSLSLDMFKSFYVYIAIISSLLLSSCKERELTLFGMDYETAITIPTTNGIDLPMNLYSPHILTNYTSIFKKEDTKEELIENARIKNFFIHSSEDQNLNSIKSITAYIRNDIDETQIASSYEIMRNQKSINFSFSTNENLKSYLSNKSFSIRLNIVTKENIETPIDLTIDMQFDITAIKK